MLQRMCSKRKQLFLVRLALHFFFKKRMGADCFHEISCTPVWVTEKHVVQSNSAIIFLHFVSSKAFKMFC